MYAGSLYFKEATGLSVYVLSVCVLIITAVYVILGKFLPLLLSVINHTKVTLTLPVFFSGFFRWSSGCHVH